MLLRLARRRAFCTPCSRDRRLCWREGLTVTLAVQGELALRQAQVEKLSAVGQRVLQTLDPLRTKCSAQLQELLVSA